VPLGELLANVRRGDLAQVQAGVSPSRAGRVGRWRVATDPFVFVSHSHLDELAAEAPTDYLLSSLMIDPALVRCRSLPGHRLAYGQTMAEQLKGDIGESSAIFELLTRAALASKWVLLTWGGMGSR
jgi:hypothetical protein